MNPRCRDCADGDGFCTTDGRGENCGFAKGHPLHRTEQFRPQPRTADMDPIDKPLDHVDRARMALGMRDAGYDAKPDIEDVEGLLAAYDRLRSEVEGAYQEGFAVARWWAAKRLEDANDETSRECIVKAIREMKPVLVSDHSLRGNP